MTLDKLIDEILQSEPSDWTSIQRPIFLQDNQAVTSSEGKWTETEEHDELLSYKNNLDISIAIGLPHLEHFHADWVHKFDDTQASSDHVDVLWCGRPVLRLIRVLVDGARAGLPPPMIGTMNVARREYEFFTLIDLLRGNGDFGSYFDRAGFKIIDEPWPD